MKNKLNLKIGDVVIIEKCPPGSWHFMYDSIGAEGHITKLGGGEVHYLNNDLSTSIGDNRTCINYTEDCLRLATTEETYAYQIGIRNIKLIRLSEFDMQCLIIQQEIHETK